MKADVKLIGPTIFFPDSMPPTKPDEKLPHFWCGSYSQRKVVKFDSKIFKNKANGF